MRSKHATYIFITATDNANCIYVSEQKLSPLKFNEIDLRINLG